MNAIQAWLIAARRPVDTYSFGVVDVNERATPTLESKAELASLLRQERFDPQFVFAMAQSLGWTRVADAVRAGLSHGQRLRKGDLGEVLLGYLLEASGYVIPVRKMRSRISSDQSQPRIDVVAMRVANGEVTEVCMGESKLRTRLDLHAGTEAYAQLVEECRQDLPEILTFVAARLFESQSPLFDSFGTFLRDRADSPGLEHRVVGLTWSRAEWDERVLQNLEDAGTDPPLDVHVIAIDDLGSLVTEVFTLAGLQVSDDED